jgi:hypothetical protein
MLRSVEDIKIAPISDAKSIAELVNDVWHQHYPSDPNLTVWPSEFFDWQFLNVPTGHPSICLGAYLNDDLLGIYCGDIWTVEKKDRARECISFMSCVSVRSGPRSNDAAAKLLAAIQSWSGEHDSYHIYGFVNPRESSMVGRRYWSTRRGCKHCFPESPRQWQIRPDLFANTAPECDEKADLDIESAAQFLHTNLTQESNRRECSLVWSLPRIKHQLRYGGLATATQELEGRDQAVCGYNILPTQGGQKVGYIDFIAASDGRDDLLKRAATRALANMKAKGCARILTLGEPTNRNRSLQDLGFVPCIPSFTPILVSWTNQTFLNQSSHLAAIYR